MISILIPLSANHIDFHIDFNIDFKIDFNIDFIIDFMKYYMAKFRETACVLCTLYIYIYIYISLCEFWLEICVTIGNSRNFEKKLPAMVKGGCRHLPKPMVDAGLVYKALAEHVDLVKDLGAYENLSRTASVDAKGLMDNLSLLIALTKAERSAEIHPQPLKAGLLKLLTEDPSLNKTKFNGQVWINLRQERLTSLLYHLRKFARDKECMKQACIKLSGADCIKLKELLGMLELRAEPVDDYSQKADSLTKEVDGACSVLEEPASLEPTQLFTLTAHSTVQKEN